MQPKKLFPSVVQYNHFVFNFNETKHIAESARLKESLMSCLHISIKKTIKGVFFKQVFTVQEIRSQ